MSLELVVEEHLAEEGPGQGPGEGVGGTMTGVGGAWAWARPNGVRNSLDGGRGEDEANSCAGGVGLSDTPSALISMLSLSFTVPPRLSACSKSRSVREIRRDSFTSFDATGWNWPLEKEVGGIGERCWGGGGAYLKNEARLNEI
jgi:hypothetical protein